MTGLPYVTPPQAQPPRRIGNAASGIIEVPVLGGLTVEESDAVAELLTDEPSAFVAGAELAAAIAAAEGCKIEKAFQIVERGISGTINDDPKAEALRLKHAARIDAVATVYQRAGAQNAAACATAIIRYRLDRPAWTLEQTRKLPRLLQEGLWQLVRDEQDAERPPAEPITEDDLKKPPADDGSPSEPTGAQSSGGLPTPIQGSGSAKRSDGN